MHQDPSVCTNFYYCFGRLLDLLCSYTYLYCIFFISIYSEHLNNTANVFAIDINECEHTPCGNNTICTDTVGSFVCSCKEDYTGDPMKGCHGINFYS